MFLETSRPRVEGDKARLTSPTFNVNPASVSSSSASSGAAYCLTFYYHMYGKHQGEGHQMAENQALLETT